ncbi:MAG: radical SAM family heme chaperone HemW [Boseongicola sp.]
MDDRPGFGLYIHWPFCQAKCPYCDFNSHVSKSIDQTAWIRAYIREIERYGREARGRSLDSVFFGGGTPSLMEPETVAAVLEAVWRTWPAPNDVEITLEANPTSVEAGRFRAFRDAGINRVSVGLQALNDPDLKALGRLHSANEGRAAFDLACKSFDRVSFDLIYARQGQSLADWRNELSQALTMANDHVSLYQLTVEAGTAFGDRHSRGLLRGLPDDDLSADMYLLTQELTSAAGMDAYEISNHAMAGAESRHNLIYWRSGDWIGIGPGAHGRLTDGESRYATDAPRSPARWLAAVERGNGESTRTALSETDVHEECVLMGLRLSEGIPEAWIPSASEKINKINKLNDRPVLHIKAGRILVLQAGRLILNALIRELLT